LNNSAVTGPGRLHRTAANPRSHWTGSSVDRASVVDDAGRLCCALRARHGHFRAGDLAARLGLRSVAGARWIVFGGLALPVVVLTPLVAYELIAGERLLPLPGAKPLRIEAKAQRWVWTFMASKPRA
jgi:hypothetical protein